MNFLSSINLRLLIIASGIVAGCLSCSHGVSQSDNSVDTISLKGAILIPYEHLWEPTSLFASYDRIFVLNSMSADTLFYEFTTSGRKVRNFLTKGSGPNEVTRMFSIYYNGANNSLCFTTPNKKLTQLNPSAEQPTLSPIFELNPENGKDINSIAGHENWMFDNGLTVSAIASDKGYFGVFDKDGIFKRFAVDPIPADDFGGNASSAVKYNFLHPWGGMSANGRHAAWVMGQADMLVIANQSADSIIFSTNYVAPPKGIKFITDDGEHFSFEYTDAQTTYFFREPTVSDSHVYVQYIGMLTTDIRSFANDILNHRSEPKCEVRVYDFDGNLIHILNLDCMYGSIAASPDDKALYIISEGSEDGINIRKYDLTFITN